MEKLSPFNRAQLFVRNKYTVFIMAVALRSVNNKKIPESYSSEASPQYSLNWLKRETYLWKKHINDTGHGPHG